MSSNFRNTQSTRVERPIQLLHPRTTETVFRPKNLVGVVQMMLK